LSNENVASVFSVQSIGVIAHNEKTRRILPQYEDYKSFNEFAHKAIIDFAKSKGFDLDPENIGLKLEYMPAIAFLWLMSLKEYQYCSKSRLMREIIIQAHR
jgi:hypothetical protein